MNKHTPIKTTELAKLSTSLIDGVEKELQEIDAEIKRIYEAMNTLPGLIDRKIEITNKRSAIYAMSNMVPDPSASEKVGESAVDDLEKQIESLAEKPKNEVKSD